VLGQRTDGKSRRNWACSGAPWQYRGPRLTEGSAWLIGDRPCPPATPCRGRPIGAVRALTLWGPVRAAVRLLIPRTHTIFAHLSSYLTLTPQVMIYFTMLYFFAYAQPIDWVGSIMFSGCPSICAYVRTSRRRHFPTG